MTDQEKEFSKENEKIVENDFTESDSNDFVESPKDFKNPSKHRDQDLDSDENWVKPNFAKKALVAIKNFIIPQSKKGKTVFKVIAFLLIMLVVGSTSYSLAAKQYYAAGISQYSAQASQNAQSGFIKVADWESLKKAQSFGQFNLVIDTVSDSEMSFTYGTTAKTIALKDSWKFDSINLFLPVSIISKTDGSTVSYANLYMSEEIPQVLMTNGENQANESLVATVHTDGYEKPEAQSGFKNLEIAHGESDLHIFVLNNQNQAGDLQTIMDVK